LFKIAVGLSEFLIMQNTYVMFVQAVSVLNVSVSVSNLKNRKSRSHQGLAYIPGTHTHAPSKQNVSSCLVHSGHVLMWCDTDLQHQLSTSASLNWVVIQHWK